MASKTKNPKLDHQPTSRIDTFDLIALLTADGAIIASGIWAAGLQSETQTAIFAVLAAVTIAWTARRLVRSMTLPSQTWPAWWLFAGGCIFLVISALATVSPIRSFERVLCLSCVLIAFVIYTSMQRNAKPEVHAMVAIWLASLIVTILGGNEYAYHAKIGDPDWRVFSTFYNPGYLSGFLSITIPVTLGLMLWVKDRGLAFGLGFTAVTQTAVLALTGTRAGVLALGFAVFAFIVLGWISRTFSRTAWARLGLFVIVAAAISGFVGRPSTSRVQVAAQQGHSLAFRQYTWKATEKMAKAKPFTGFGPGAFEVAFPRYEIAGFTRMAHSIYLQAAAEYGIPATVLLFASWFWLVGTCKLKLLRRQLTADTSLFAIAALSGMGATLLRGVFDSDWWCLPILLVVSVLSAVLAVVAGIERPSTQTPLARGTAIAACGLMLLGCFGAHRWMMSWIANQSGRQAEAQAQYGAAQANYRRAGQLFPWNINPRLRNAQLQAMDTGNVPLDVFAQLRHLEPTNVKIPRALFQVYQNQAKPQLALKALKEARALDPKASRLMLEEAILLEHLGNKIEAERIWRAMLDLEKSPYGSVRAIPEIVDPTFAWAHAAVGDQLSDRGNAAEARAQWQAGLTLLKKYFESAKTMRPVLDAAGLTDEELDKNGRQLQLLLQAKIRKASAARL